MWNVFQKNKSDKEAGDIILRTNFAFSKAISVGQIIMAHTFSKLKELKNIDREAELDITDTQIAQFSKEISKLLLFWLTRDIWTYLVEDETDAKKQMFFYSFGLKSGMVLNILILRNTPKQRGLPKKCKYLVKMWRRFLIAMVQ